MGSNVHINVVFASGKNEGVANLAAKHRALLPDPIPSREADWFLDELSTRTGQNIGPKGGLSMWGMVGNYTNGDGFVEVLRPFFSELLSGAIDGGPLAHEHVIVFVEQEQRGRATAFEIFLTDPAASELTVIKHDCPFSWM